MVRVFRRQHNKLDQRDLMLNLPIGLKWKNSAWLGPNNKSKFCLVFVLGLGGSKQKSSQVLDMFPKEFPIAPHFHLVCFGKCCRPFTFIGGPKGGRNSILQNKTFYFGGASIVSFFLSDGPIKLAHWKRNKKIGNLGGTSSN
jgi:hypothetical protein